MNTITAQSCQSPYSNGAGQIVLELLKKWHVILQSLHCGGYTITLINEDKGATMRKKRIMVYLKKKQLMCA